LRSTTAVRIFSPELLSVDGFNTNFEMYKLKQKSINVNMSGKSSFEIESMIPALDTLTIAQKDSSEVIFEMSPDYKPTDQPKVITFKTNNGGVGTYTQSEIKSNEAMSIQSVHATVRGYSLLDLGHAQIQSLQLNISDSSGIILSGGALKKVK
jgi:hypothetical protein